MKTRMKTMLMSLLICSVCCAQHIKPRPSFPGGYKALQEFIEKEKKYPDEALKKREEGAVYVVFTVDTLGNVVHPKVATSVSPSLDREALRIVRKMPKWIPAREGNKKINTAKRTKSVNNSVHNADNFSIEKRYNYRRHYVSPSTS